MRYRQRKNGGSGGIRRLIEQIRTDRTIRKDDWFRTLAVARNNGIKLITFETVSLFANYRPNDVRMKRVRVTSRVTCSVAERCPSAVHWTCRWMQITEIQRNPVQSTLHSVRKGVLSKDANRKDAGAVSIWLFLNHILRHSSALISVGHSPVNLSMLPTLSML